jgi:hypothetical protein
MNDEPIRFLFDINTGRPLGSGGRTFGTGKLPLQLGQQSKRLITNIDMTHLLSFAFNK